MLDVFVSGQTSKVEAGQVDGGLACTCEFGFGTVRTGDDRDSSEICLLRDIKWLTEWFWGPFVYEFVYLLRESQHWMGIYVVHIPCQ